MEMFLPDVFEDSFMKDGEGWRGGEGGNQSDIKIVSDKAPVYSNKMLIQEASSYNL